MRADLYGIRYIRLGESRLFSAVTNAISKVLQVHDAGLLSYTLSDFVWKRNLMNCGKYRDADKAKRMDLADQFVVGGAVGLSLAWRTALSHP